MTKKIILSFIVAIAFIIAALSCYSQSSVLSGLVGESGQSGSSAVSSKDEIPN